MAPLRILLSAWLVGVLALLATSPAVAASTLADSAAAWEARDAATLRRTAPKLAEASISDTFDAMSDRVPAYADWIYGWFSSLTTASQLAYAGISEVGSALAGGRPPEASAIQARFVELIEQRFESTVVQPASSAKAIREAWRRSVNRLAEFDRRLAQERRERIEREGRRLGIDPQPLLERHGSPLLSSTLNDSAPPSDLVSRSMTDPDLDAGGTSDVVLFRSLRPLATRVVSAAVRLVAVPIAGSIFGLPATEAGGFLSGFATASAASAGVWGLDYLVNWTDARLSRPTLEAALRDALRGAKSRASAAIRRHAESATCSALVVPAGCPAPPAVAADARTG